jgi:hypothetical protein
MNADNRLNAIGVLRRREIEARIVGPLLAALSENFDREEVLDTARQVIVEIARRQGEMLAEEAGGCSLAHFARSLDAWKKGEAMELEVLEDGENVFAFNVTRCKYAEMYRELGIPELGEMLSCSRDAALIEGFNPQIQLVRTQTIMAGAKTCDFRYRVMVE